MNIYFLLVRHTNGSLLWWVTGMIYSYIVWHWNCMLHLVRHSAYPIVVTDESNTTTPLHVELPWSTPEFTVYVPPVQLNVNVFACAAGPLNRRWLRRTITTIQKFLDFLKSLSSFRWLLGIRTISNSQKNTSALIYCQYTALAPTNSRNWVLTGGDVQTAAYTRWCPRWGSNPHLENLRAVSSSYVQ